MWLGKFVEGEILANHAYATDGLVIKKVLGWICFLKCMVASGNCKIQSKRAIEILSCCN